jgi:hypothetical protein
LYFELCTLSFAAGEITSKVKEQSTKGGFNLEVPEHCCLSPIRGEMFIELVTAKDFFSLQRSETSADLALLPETLRSAGAPLIVRSVIYKHLAPMERN